MVKYPAALDSQIELPTVVNNSTLVDESLINNLRDAILAIENELGIKPSGIYSNVRTRVNSIESAIAGLVAGTITLGGDLATLTVSTQKVVGLQTFAVSSATPTDGYVLTWNNAGSTWQPQKPPPYNVKITSTAISYSVLLSDYHISCTAGGITITLPTNPSIGDSYEVKDANANATLSPITINGGGKNIDGAATASISANYGRLIVRYNGTQWSTI